MLRKSVFLFLAVAVLLGGFMVPSKSAQAARPEPPTVEGIQPPAIDFANPPETVQKAVDLQNSLTSEQHAAVRAILDKYLPELESIQGLMAAQGKPQRTEPAQLDSAILSRLAKVVADIEADMAGVLSADQFALFQAVTRPARSGVQMSVVNSAGLDGYYTDYCWYGAYEDAISWYYGYYGYLYSYYNYYYNGGTYAYEAYYYAYYGWYYAGLALDYSGPTYFQSYYVGMWWTDYPYYAYLYSYYAYYYMYYATDYAYYNYYYYGWTYAYYAYYYNYYAYYYGYWSYYDTYYCYYYLY
jgi:hypothetical protein